MRVCFLDSNGRPVGASRITSKTDWRRVLPDPELFTRSRIWHFLRTIFYSHKTENNTANYHTNFRIFTPFVNHFDKHKSDICIPKHYQFIQKIVLRELVVFWKTFVWLFFLKLVYERDTKMSTVFHLVVLFCTVFYNSRSANLEKRLSRCFRFYGEFSIMVSGVSWRPSPFLLEWEPWYVGTGTTCYGPPAAVLNFLNVATTLYTTDFIPAASLI